MLDERVDDLVIGGVLEDRAGTGGKGLSGAAVTMFPDCCDRGDERPFEVCKGEEAPADGDRRWTACRCLGSSISVTCR